MLTWSAYDAVADALVASRAGGNDPSVAVALKFMLLLEVAQREMAAAVDEQQDSRRGTGSNGPSFGGDAHSIAVCDAANGKGSSAAANSTLPLVETWVSLGAAESLLAGTTEREVSAIGRFLAAAGCTSKDRASSIAVEGVTNRGTYYAGAADVVVPPLRRELLVPLAAFSVAADRGVLLLSPASRDDLTVHRVDVEVDADAPGCLGGPVTRWMLRRVAGYDTVVMYGVLAARRHWLPARHRGENGGGGYVLVESRGDILPLSHATEVERFNGGAVPRALLKVGTLFGGVFLLFATSSLTAFILGQTQQRMLRFTTALHETVRGARPLLPLIAAHLLSSLVFVPIMLGVLFFLFEFFADQLLAFLVLLLVWAAELWAAVAMRTQESLRVFPRVFCLLLVWFHVYYLSYPFGYQYLGLEAVATALCATAFHLWSGKELPALLGGRLTAAAPREASVVAARQWFLGLPEGAIASRAALDASPFRALSRRRRSSSGIGDGTVDVTAGAQSPLPPHPARGPSWTRTLSLAPETPERPRPPQRVDGGGVTAAALLVASRTALPPPSPPPHTPTTATRSTSHPSPFRLPAVGAAIGELAATAGVAAAASGLRVRASTAGNDAAAAVAAAVVAPISAGLNHLRRQLPLFDDDDAYETDGLDDAFDPSPPGEGQTDRRDDSDALRHRGRRNAFR